MQTYSPTQLRQNIYKVLNRVAKTGNPVAVETKKGRLQIVPEKPKSKLANLKKRDILLCDPEEIVHCDWSKEWNPDKKFRDL